LGAHVFRAFDGIEPGSVRCLLLGQDPYPSVGFSTGRAFESGEHKRWRDLDNMFSSSMRCLLQSLAAFRTGCSELAKQTRNWPDALRWIETAQPRFPAPTELTDHWVDQGVLPLNASLTLTRFSVEGHPHQTQGHIPLWRPLMVRLMQHFAECGRPVCFLLFGTAAQDAAIASGISHLRCRRADNAHPGVVCAPHPAAGDAFLAEQNPFSRCNRALVAQGGEPIDW